jgi:hypothetical protein
MRSLTRGAAKRQAILVNCAFFVTTKHFRHDAGRSILSDPKKRATIRGHPFVFILSLIFARLAITLSEWEFLQLFGVDRNYRMARSAFGPRA